MRPATLICVLLLAAATFAQEDRLTLSDGSDAGGAVKGVYREGVVVDGWNGDAVVPWNRISLISSAAPVTVEFGAGDKVSGYLVGIDGSGTVAVRSELLGVVRVPIGSLVSRPEPEPAPTAAGGEQEKTPLEPHDWKGHVALGGSITRGNSEIFDVNLDTKVIKQTGHDRIELAAFIVRTVSLGETTADAQRVQGSWRHFYSDRFYSYASLEAGRDSIQAVDLRLLANIGAGITLWKESDDELFSVEGGLGFRHESFEDDDDGRNDATVRVAAVYKDIFFEKAKYDQTVEVIAPVQEPGALLARFEAGLSLSLSEAWSLRNTLRLTYRGDTPDTSKAFDIFFGVGLQYTF